MKHETPRMNEGAPHWQAARSGVLSIPRCTQCVRSTWPPRDACIHCGGTLEWTASSGHGTLVTWSVVRRAADPALKDAVPYVIGIVELDEGVRLFTNIVDADLSTLRISMSVTCRFEPTLDDAAWVAVFTPG